MADADPKRAIAAGPALTVPTEAPPPRKERRLLRSLLMFGVPVLLAAIAGYVYLTSGRYISTDNAYVQQDMISVSPDVSGRIVSVEVRENQRVKAGDVLFRIDPEPYRIALAQADADLATARVQVSTMATDTGSAAADIQNAKAEQTLAQATYARQAALMKQGFTTRASFDAATQGVAAADAKLATAQAAAARARQQLGSGGGTGQPAAIQVALAKREKAAYDLERTVARPRTASSARPGGCRSATSPHPASQRLASWSASRRGSRPISRKPISTTCASASRPNLPSMPIRGSRCVAMSSRSARAPAANSRCSRRKTPTAIGSR